MNKHWSNYWQMSQLSSVAERTSVEVNDALLRGWEVGVSSLPDRPVVLDLCCGNGDAILTVKELLESKCKGISQGFAVDLAKIDKTQLIKAGINVKDETSIESLELINIKVDLCISQFGIEYCAFENAIDRVVKHLSENAQINFLMHAENSIVTRTSVEELKFYQYLLDDSSFSQLSRSLYRECASKNKRQQHSLRKFNEWMMVTIDQFGNLPLLYELMKSIKAALANLNNQPKKLANELNSLDKQIRFFDAHSERLKEMIGAALTPKKLDNYKAILANYQFYDINSEYCYVDNELFGIWLRAKHRKT